MDPTRFGGRQTSKTVLRHLGAKESTRGATWRWPVWVQPFPLAMPMYHNDVAWPGPRRGCWTPVPGLYRVPLSVSFACGAHHAPGAGSSIFSWKFFYLKGFDLNYSETSLWAPHIKLKIPKTQGQKSFIVFGKIYIGIRYPPKIRQRNIDWKINWCYWKKLTFFEDLATHLRSDNDMQKSKLRVGIWFFV